MFGDLGVNRFLAPFATTVIELPTDRPGTVEFSCAMNMIHGTVILDGEPAAAPVVAPASARGARDAAVTDSGEDEARRAELRDLARRVLIGAVISRPASRATDTGANGA